MKTLIACLVTGILLIAAPAFAGEWLVCDPNPTFKSFDVEVNGVVIAQKFPAESDGSIKWNVTSFDPGIYTFRIRAYGEGDWPGPWSDPFDAGKPGVISGQRILVD